MEIMVDNISRNGTNVVHLLILRRSYPFPLHNAYYKDFAELKLKKINTTFSNLWKFKCNQSIGKEDLLYNNMFLICFVFFSKNRQLN